MLSPSRKFGFTLVELLVVIAIIGILIALLLPAVQSAREAARRTQCANNLKQMGLAVLNFEFTHGTLPTSFAYDGSADTPVAPPTMYSGKGWILNVLPYLEQQNLYDEFETNQGFIGPYSDTAGLRRPECREAIKTPIDVLQCPSDSSSSRFSTEQWQWEGIEVFLTNYKGVMGDNRMGGSASIHAGSEPSCTQTRNCPGIFWRHSYLRPVTMASIRDGASNTLLVGETRPRYFPASAAYFSNGDYASTSMPLNYVPEPFDRTEWWNYWGFSSDHAGIVQFCLADGSVRSLSESMDQQLYRHLSTKNGNEVVNW